MNVSGFLRLYQVRAPNIMWLLGAGSSAAAGIPTACDMIWDFKRKVYCSEQKKPITFCQDLSDPVLQLRLQQFLDRTNKFPSNNSDKEYSEYFEYVYPAESDRRKYINDMLSGIRASYGHIALAALMKIDKARIIWTTNFDTLIEDTAIEMFGSSSDIVIADLDHPDLAIESLNESRWPLIVKLHGDFRSRKLKNTKDELSNQDAKLRRALVLACKRNGLAVIGYSGRDKSVMTALMNAIDDGDGFPQGIFWFHRSNSQLLPSVEELIKKARKYKIQAETIPVETFDELIGDLLILESDLPNDVKEKLKLKEPRVSDAPIPKTKGNWPAIRLNAFPIISAPNVCRLVICNIGGTKQVLETIKNEAAEIVAMRKKIGVIAFGQDDSIRKVFEPFDITKFDIYNIEQYRLSFESAEQGLFYDAMVKAIIRSRPLLYEKKRQRHILYVDPSKKNHQLFNGLRKTTGIISGNITGTSLKWAEAIQIRFEYRLKSLWLVVEPTIWTQRTDDERIMISRNEFIQKRLSSRYNIVWNYLIENWRTILLEGRKECALSSFGISDGIDATFKLSGITAFSRRQVA